jgi:Family of unknown function (DUF5996)
MRATRGRRSSGYAYPAPPEFPGATLPPAEGRWDEQLGEYLLDWEDVRAATGPRAVAVEFARLVFRHACQVCEWDAELTATIDGRPPSVR